MKKLQLVDKQKGRNIMFYRLIVINTGNEDNYESLICFVSTCDDEDGLQLQIFIVNQTLYTFDYK